MSVCAPCADFNFHSCCACGATGPSVRNILMLDRLCPTPGKGWGCLTCGLPMNGALVILCDACLEAGADPKFVCTGWATEPERTPIVDLSPDPFGHVLHRHPEFNRARYGTPYPN